jgi:hypothetical protein
MFTFEWKSARLAEFTGFIRGLGSDAVTQGAMARGLNEHIVRQEKQAITTLAASTGLTAGYVGGATTHRKAAPGPSMSAAVVVKGGAIPAGKMTKMEWNRGMIGARHGDWPTYSRRGGQTRGTFIGKGVIYKRLGKDRTKLKKISGPVLPNELLRRDMPTYPAAEGLANADLQRSVIRALMHAHGF